MMMNQVTFQRGLYVDYPIQYPISGSSMEEPDIKEVLDNLYLSSILDWEELITRIFHQNFHQSLLSLFEIDFSSVWPYFEVRSESLTEAEKISEEMIAAEMLMHDLIVCIPPKKKYRVEIELKSIKKGEPIIVVPEEFL